MERRKGIITSEHDRQFGIMPCRESPKQVEVISKHVGVNRRIRHFYAFIQEIYRRFPENIVKKEKVERLLIRLGRPEFIDYLDCPLAKLIPEQFFLGLRIR